LILFLIVDVPNRIYKKLVICIIFIASLKTFYCIGSMLMTRHNNCIQYYKLLGISLHKAENDTNVGWGRWGYDYDLLLFLSVNSFAQSIYIIVSCIFVKPISQ